MLTCGPCTPPHTQMVSKRGVPEHSHSPLASVASVASRSFDGQQGLGGGAGPGSPHQAGSQLELVSPPHAQRGHGRVDQQVATLVQLLSREQQEKLALHAKCQALEEELQRLKQQAERVRLMGLR